MIIKIDVTDSQGQTHNGIFASQAKADQWIADHKSQWGQEAIPARAQVPAIPEVLNADGTVKTPAIPGQAAQTEVPATYSITQTDITEDVEIEAKAKKGLLAQNLGSEVIAAVYSINDQANVSVAQMTALMGDQTVLMAERLLWNGALESAKTVLSNVSITLFSAEQIAGISALIDEKIAARDKFETDFIANYAGA